MGQAYSDMKRSLQKFADKPFREKLSFLQRVFDGKEIKDLSLLKEAFALFDDEVKVPSSPGTSTAMEYLCEASVYAVSIQKPDGIQMTDMLKQDSGE